ncbi:MAG TPA: transcriptional regulator NrdR [Elusimicrobia bacterium]|jgi:transcriptional repressor NrdR|nr:transcriptional regulator NrdR [Elusimicrobiota bacterium]
MRCPYCRKDRDEVIDTRQIKDAAIIRRRRQCKVCGKRFTTYERLEEMPLMVIKANNQREPFNRDKLREGIMRACEKRPISLETIEKIVSEIEYELRDYLMEAKSNIIGEKVLEKLRKIDDVAYIRFASVYRKFPDITTFFRELEKIQNPKEVTISKRKTSQKAKQKQQKE